MEKEKRFELCKDLESKGFKILKAEKKVKGVKLHIGFVIEAADGSKSQLFTNIDTLLLASESL